MAWLLIAIASGLLAAVFVATIFLFFVAIPIAALGVAIPLAFVSGLWGFRSRRSAKLAAGYGALTGTTLVLLDGLGPIWGVLPLVAGLLSALAAREIGLGKVPPRGSV